jgi:hypothetical protein
VSNPRQNFFGACEQTSTLPAKMPPKFVPRQRKHKAIARQKAAASRDAATIDDANTAEILPLEQQERNQKKAALKDELVRESQGKVTGKKKKRLEKYIVRLTRARSDRKPLRRRFAPRNRSGYLQD